MSVKILGSTDEYDTCGRCGREGLTRVVVIAGTVEGVDVSGRYGTECVRRVMGLPAAVKAAVIDRRVAAADAERAHQQYLLKRWAPYRTPMGVITFRARNLGTTLTDAEVMARATQIVDTARAYLAPFAA